MSDPLNVVRSSFDELLKQQHEVMTKLNKEFLDLYVQNIRLKDDIKTLKYTNAVNKGRLDHADVKQAVLTELTVARALLLSMVNATDVLNETGKFSLGGEQTGNRSHFESVRQQIVKFLAEPTSSNT